MIYTLTLNPAVDRELTVPAIEFDTVLRATAWQVDCGGKGFNVSRMLQALGMPSTALALAGGRSGDLLRDGLHALGIRTDFIAVEGETRTNVSIVTSDHDRYIKVNEPGPSVRTEDQRNLLDKVRSLARSGDWWVLSGSLPPGIETDLYAQLVRIIQHAGARAILDTSGTALREGCQARPYLVKPNEVEAQALTGLSAEDDRHQPALIDAVLAMGPAHVVLSLGSEGALFGDGQRHWRATPPRIAERNPIGAGDSMVGGLVWALSQGQSLPEAMRWAMACGAATASQPGTTVGSLAQIEGLVPEVRIRPLP